MGNADKLANAINAARRKQNGGAVRGIIAGGQVRAGGKVFPAIYAVDVQTYEGKTVWCLISDGRAVIVGD